MNTITQSDAIGEYSGDSGREAGVIFVMALSILFIAGIPSCAR